MPKLRYVGSMRTGEKTSDWGGGDMPLVSVRHFRYTFDETFWSRFKRRKYVVELPYEAPYPYPTPIKHYKEHKAYYTRILLEKPFTIKGRNVLEWFGSMAIKGSVVVTFEVDSSVEHVIGGRLPVYTMAARFSDPGMAAMFKLAFAGL